MPKRKHASEKKRAVKAEEELEELENEGQEEPASSSGDEDAFPSEEEHDEESSEDDEDGEAFDSIDVDFLCADPEEEDFHGLKTLLTNFLDGKQFSSSELVDAIIANPAGSVIKCGEEDDAIGVASVLQVSQHKDSEFLAEIEDFVKEHCSERADAEKITAAFAAPSSALLISERLLNSPPQLAPPLMESLIQEAEAMAKENGSKINQYIFMTRAYNDPTSTAPAAASEKATSKKKKESKQVSDLIFATPEGEFLVSKASVAFSFAVPNRAVGKDDLLPQRVVAVVPAKEVAGALKEMRAVVAE